MNKNKAYKGATIQIKAKGKMTNGLYSQIVKHFPEIIKNLNEEEKELLLDDYFLTESCGDCSKLKWGFYKESELVEDSNGCVASCTIDGKIIELDFAPNADSLSAKDALNWWFNEGPGSLYLEKRCSGFDGKTPYTKEEIIEFIEKRNALIERIIGFKGANMFEDVPDYFVENLYLATKEIIDPKKLEFGNKKHIEMILGKEQFPESIYKTG